MVQWWVLHSHASWPARLSGSISGCPHHCGFWTGLCASLGLWRHSDATTLVTGSQSRRGLEQALSLVFILLTETEQIKTLSARPNGILQASSSSTTTIIIFLNLNLPLNPKHSLPTLWLGDWLKPVKMTQTFICLTHVNISMIFPHCLPLDRPTKLHLKKKIQTRTQRH